jgi:hypothetical protein
MWVGTCCGEANELARTTFLAVIRRIRSLRRYWVYIPALFAGMYTQSADGRAVFTDGRAVLAVIFPTP